MTAETFYAAQKLTAGEVQEIATRVDDMTGASVSNSIAETVIATVTIPAGDPGLVADGGYKLIASLLASCTGTPTLTIRIRETSATGALLAQFGAITMTSNASNATAWLDYEMFITAPGSSGTLNGLGKLVSSFGGTPYVFVGSGTQGTAVNTTGAVVLVVTAQWSAASTSNVATGAVGALDRI